MSSISALIISASVVLVACGSDDGGTAEPGGAGGTSGGGKGGTSQGGSAGTNGGTNQGGKAGTSAGSAGSGGSVIIGVGGAGTGGTDAGGAAGTAGGAAGSTSGSGGQAGEACQGEPGKNVKQCRPATDNECDGKDYPGFKPEGTNGNGFDDDCDGLVDEGCSCENQSAGATKDCYALPSSQTSGAPDWKPVGECANPNNGQLGKATCKIVGEGEFAQKLYTGECVGAQPPPADDTCDTTKDVNCDGVNGNAPDKCKCSSIVCPTVLYTTPFPDPKNIGQFAKTQVGPTDPKDVDGIDGISWLGGNQKIIESVKNWRWSVTGGPCDDTLPNPTFALFPSKEGTPVVPWASHLGVRTTGLPNFPGTPGDPAIHQGWVVAENGPSKIYPAFSLSGDYYITGKFTYNDPLNGDKETEGLCTQIVKVRAPGLRVELCWPEVGSGQKDNDVDLHVARLQGNTPTTGKHGWFNTAGNAPNADDCYYSPNSACGNRFSTAGTISGTPGWYANETTEEPGNVGVCHGWGSRRFDGTLAGTALRLCTSPRLDRDNIDCDRNVEDPNYPEQDKNQLGEINTNFCGPENINIDGQVLTAGDRFAVGVQCYNCVLGNNGTDGKPSHPRVNIFCNGEYKLGFGYDPSKPLDDTNAQYPQLLTEGQHTSGAFWNAGVVTWNGGDDPCTITSVAPNAPDQWNANAWREKANGSPQMCVYNGGLNEYDGQLAPTDNKSTDWLFTSDGGYPDPANPNALCPY